MSLLKRSRKNEDNVSNLLVYMKFSRYSLVLNIGGLIYFVVDFFFSR